MKKANGFTQWVCVFLLVAPLAFAQNQHAFVWSSSTGMVDIGTLGGNNSYALQINDLGEVVGWSYLADNVTTHVFTWTSGGGMVDIGTLPGGCCSQGSAINSAGNLATDAIGADGLQRPAYWNGSMFSMGTFTGNQLNYAFGINDHNQLTGQVYDGEIVNAFLWMPPTPFTPLGHLPGGLHSVGNAINNHTVIVGTASLADGSFTTMLWSSGVMHNIGIFPGGGYTAATAINDSNQVVGWGFTNSSRTKASAFYWTDPGLHVLTSFGGNQTLAFGISGKGFIVGYSELAGNTAIHAALWDSYTSAPIDLGTLPGGNNSYARGLNNALQVVGFADVP